MHRRKKFFSKFIDYEKAFDKVDHGSLWQKLGQEEITGNVVRVFQSLYQKTKAYVRTKGELTSDIDCKLGVPQGDNLSPLLIVIFLSDFNSLIPTGFIGICLNAEQTEGLTIFSKLYSVYMQMIRFCLVKLKKICNELSAQPKMIAFRIK